MPTQTLPEKIAALTVRLEETFPVYAMGATVPHVEKGWSGTVVQVVVGSTPNIYKVRWTATGRGSWESFHHAMDFTAP